ncbi:MAG: hypothetical protein ABIG36_22840 [Pseudomonadota bacterium]
MGILTNIVAAEEDEYAAIGESLRPVDEWSGIERRGIDTAKIATLHCLLTGDEFEEAVGSYEPVYVADEGAVVLRIADEVMERLATLDRRRWNWSPRNWPPPKSTKWSSGMRRTCRRWCSSLAIWRAWPNRRGRCCSSGCTRY